MLSSKEFTMTGAEQCASFRFYMDDKHGCDAGRLSVFIDCVGVEEVLFQESRSFGKKWIEHMIDINKPSGTKCKVKTNFSF